MRLAVAGLGLVSPAGFTSSEHVFFLRAGAPPPQPSPFVLANGEPMRAAYCPWIGARAPASDRIARMALSALYEATMSLEGEPALERAPLLLCTSRPRPGFSEADRAHLERTLLGRLRGSEITSFLGEASVFAALRVADERITTGKARSAVIVAVDSLVSIDALTARLAHPPSPWALEQPMPAEGAAALVVMDDAEARRIRRPVLGIVHGASVAPGTSTDEDDEIVDGVGMSRAIQGLPASPRIGAVFGQLRVDSLRLTEWLLALARNAERFESEHEVGCPEVDIGLLGAASGAFNLVYGLAVMRHDAAESPRVASAPLLAWAISRDGTRGAALATGGSA
jgi:hypothetical protein